MTGINILDTTSSGDHQSISFEDALYIFPLDGTTLHNSDPYSHLQDLQIRPHPPPFSFTLNMVTAMFAEAESFSMQCSYTAES
jgi:hypothetical protein